MRRCSARTWRSVDRGKRGRGNELRKHPLPVAEPVGWREGNTIRIATRDPDCSGGVEDPRMRGHVSDGSRETSERSVDMNQQSRLPAGGKASRRNPSVRSPEESDDRTVPKKPANKGVSPPAEWAEGQRSTKRNPEKDTADCMQGQASASTGLDRVRERVNADKHAVFSNLFHFLKEDLLISSFLQLKRNAAPGMDGKDWTMVAQELGSRMATLRDELHRGSYKATPAKRVYIAKSDGKRRPLGIQTVEDKLVQQAVVNILTEVYEPTFLGLNYGYRPGRKQHDALDALHEGICGKRINWILDCDIEGFFDQIPHDALMDILSQRIQDKRLIRLIRKWLKVGWVEDGKRHPGIQGTPQGAVISPILSNVFLHHVMDKWFRDWRRSRARGDVMGVRYADDAVFGFQYEGEARRFLAALSDRLSKYGLKLNAGKTRLIEFGRFAASNRKQRGEDKPETFSFLGFTHSCGKTRTGKFALRRKTERKRLTGKIKDVKDELRKRMHDPVSKTGRWLRSVIQGFTGYAGVPGNNNAIRAFYTAVSRHWLFTLRRRSHKARERWTWDRFYRFQEQWLERPRICHPYPSDRFRATHSR